MQAFNSIILKHILEPIGIPESREESWIKKYKNSMIILRIRYFMLNLINVYNANQVFLFNIAS